MATYTDDFNRAGPALGAPWAVVIGSGLVIDTNEVKAGGSGVNVSALTGQTYTDDQTAAATATTINGFDFTGVAVRMDGSGNGYVAMAHFGDGRFYLYRADAGVLTSLGFRSVSFIANDVIKVGVVGTTFTLYVNDVAQGATFTDATYSSGVAGIAYDVQGSNASRMDDFEATGAVIGPTVTQTDATPEDGVQQSFTTSGLTGTITAATLAGKNILSLLSDTDPTTATTYTLDVSATEASTGQPRIGETSTLSITATGGTATQNVVIQPKTGWARVVLAGTLNKDADGFLEALDSALGITSAVGNIIYYDATSSAAITAQGVYTSDLTTAGQSTAFVIQQGGSATTVATSEGGAFYPFGVSGARAFGAYPVESNTVQANPVQSVEV